MATTHNAGFNVEAVRANTRDHVLISWSVQSQTKPRVIVDAIGCWFYDSEGKAYLDFNSQLVNLNIGHRHPRVIAAIKEQAEKLPYIEPGFANEARATLGSMIAEIAPGDLCKVLFTTGGSEANENAIKIARLFTGRQKIISRYRSYHGATMGSLSAGADYRRWPFEPGVPGTIRVFEPYCYRCAFSQKPGTCRLECVSHVEEIIIHEGPEQIAAMIVETVTGGSGVIVPDPRYFPALRALLDKYSILLICDEVMTGFGRTGRWFGIQNWDTVPDIITFAKGVNSGYVPLGGVIVSKKIADYFEDRMLPVGCTYSGHPLACAAGVASINVMRDEGLIENAQRLGALQLELMKDIMKRHPSVGDVRSIGLFGCFEMVKNRETREMLVPWNSKGLGPVMSKLRDYLMSRGLNSGFRWNTFKVAPPLIVTESELRQGLAIIDEALQIADDAVLDRE